MGSDSIRFPRIVAGRFIARLVTSERRTEILRRWRIVARRLARRPATVHYFHQSDDPYSQLAAGVLAQLEARYTIRLDTHAVPPPELAAAPQAEALRQWSLRDATRWAQHFGLAPPSISPPGLGRQPLALAEDAENLEAGRILRRKLGHYLGGMFYFEGEWYWGLDRLHYLESRLLKADLLRAGRLRAGLLHADPSPAVPGPLFPPPPLQFASISPGTRSPTLEFFCSLRSPYTWLATPRVRALARHYGATLKLRFVLPMVMRGLPVPLAKRLYILKDSKREALRLGLPFGDVADPVGEPTERGLAVLHHAVQSGCGEEFLESFLRGVFAEGIDAGSACGLESIAARAGLSARDVADALADESWRAVADTHRAQLFAAGLWGVPSFRVDDLPALWGQDRLWMIEQDLLTASVNPSSSMPRT